MEIIISMKMLMMKRNGFPMHLNKLWDRYKVLDASREEFVANVSHELKTPLTSM